MLFSGHANVIVDGRESILSLYCADIQLGREAKTGATEEFKELEVEMSMRQEGLAHAF